MVDYPTGDASLFRTTVIVMSTPPRGGNLYGFVIVLYRAQLGLAWEGGGNPEKLYPLRWQSDNLAKRLKRHPEEVCPSYKSIVTSPQGAPSVAKLLERAETPYPRLAMYLKVRELAFIQRTPGASKSPGVRDESAE